MQWDAYTVEAVLAWRERPFRFSDEIEEDAWETELDEMPGTNHRGSRRPLARVSQVTSHDRFCSPGFMSMAGAASSSGTKPGGNWTM